MRTSDSCITESVSQCNTPEKDRGVKASVASAPVKTSYTIKGNNLITQYEVRAEGKQPEQYVFTQFASYSKCWNESVQHHENYSHSRK